MSKEFTPHTKFAELVQEVKNYLLELKASLDAFDAAHKDFAERAGNLNHKKDGIFKFFNEKYVAIWMIAKDLPPEEFKSRQRYLQEQLNPLLYGPELNNRIYQKPFGYAGDFVIMNYICDYQGDKYLGTASYEMLLNSYVCNMPTTRSNPLRIKYIISNILRMMNADKALYVLSVACGSAMELFEIMDRGQVKGDLNFTCFDLEPKAIEFIQKRLAGLDEALKRRVSVRLINDNALNIIRRKALRESIGGHDLVYAIGLYDYLNDNIANKLTAALFSLVKPGGKLIVVNISLEQGIYRAYYEMIGEWYMYHRTKDDMLKWTEGLEGLKNKRFDEPKGGEAYYYMIVEKD